MIIKLFKSRVSNGKSPVRYLLGEKDHKGDDRSSVEILEGNPDTTIQVIDSIKRQIKYTSGCIAFAKSEQPSRKELLKIIDSFKQTFYAGLTGDNFNALFVLHRELHGMHVHFLLPSVELTTGRKLNPHPPGKRNIAFFETFTKVTNAEMGYQQIKPDPWKLAFSDFERRTEKGSEQRSTKVEVHKDIILAVQSGLINNRDELCSFLQKKYGCEITRRGQDYISVKFPGEDKAKRYRGELYKADTNYRTLFEQARFSLPPTLQPAEINQLKGKLDQFVSERKAFNTKAYLTPRMMRSKAVQLNRINPKIITTRSNAMNQLFLPIMKRIISEALGVARERNREENHSISLPSQTTVAENIRSRRNKATAKVDDDYIPSGGGDDFHGLKMSIAEVESSMLGAATAMGEAKSPEARARASDRLIKLRLQLEKLHHQLQMAKIRQASQNSMPRSSGLKI